MDQDTRLERKTGNPLGCVLILSHIQVYCILMINILPSPEYIGGGSHTCQPGCCEVQPAVDNSQFSSLFLLLILLSPSWLSLSSLKMDLEHERAGHDGSSVEHRVVRFP